MLNDAMSEFPSRLAHMWLAIVDLLVGSSGAYEFRSTVIWSSKIMVSIAQVYIKWCLRNIIIMV